MRIQNLNKNRTICSRAVRADRFGQRARGLMFRREWDGFDGLLLAPCNAVHTCFMQMIIDVCFLDREGTVVRLFPGLPPWRMARGGPSSRDTLELPHGVLEREGIDVGDRLLFHHE